MKKYLGLIIFILLILVPELLMAYPLDTSKINTQLKSTSFSERTQGLLSAAYYEKFILGDQVKADSLCKKSILESYILESHSEMIQSAIIYAQLCLSSNTENAQKYLNEAIELAHKKQNTEVLFNLTIQQASLAIRSGQADFASKFIQKTVEYIDNSKYRKIQYYLTLGDIQNASKDKISSFSNYNNAIYLAKEIENDSLTLQGYLRLYDFFLLKGKDGKAKEYLNLALETYSNSPSKDQYDSLLIKANQVELYTRENNDELAINLAEGLMNFADTKGYLAIKDRIFGSLRKYYLSNNKFKEICNLYCTKYPSELERLRTNDKAVYFRVKALIFENLNQPDSAEYTLLQAEALLTDESNPANAANFHKRKGQFYLRQNRVNDAINAFKQSHDFALQSRYYPFIIETSSILDSLYQYKGMIQEAYQYAKLKYIYTDSNNAVLQLDQMSEIEIDNNLRLKKLEDEKQEIILNQKSNFQVMIIIIAILFSLIILVLLSSYRIPASIVKGFGYMTFVLVFEFIIYLLDTKIHHWAHGQPLKIMAVKIILIAILLPLHHATEHKVVQYLLKNKLISQSSTSIKTAFGNFKEWLLKALKKGNESQHHETHTPNDEVQPEA